MNTTGGTAGAARSRCSSGSSQRSGRERNSPPNMRQLTFPLPTMPVSVCKERTAAPAATDAGPALAGL